MSERRTFVELALKKEIAFSTLCKRFNISRPTGYKWVRRGTQKGTTGLAELPRRPLRSPRRTPTTMEAAVTDVRQHHPAWGGRKIARVLLDRNMTNVPAPSTITDILHRHELITAAEACKHHAWERFEHAAPNDLWQMDFKGHVPMIGSSLRCHPLTVLDDHSRFNIVLRACPAETSVLVQEALRSAFRQYGMPLSILCDNGTPWGMPSGEWGFTQLGLWIIRLGIRLTHGRPYHPQTQGKAERFHRTLLAELLRPRLRASCEEYQRDFDPWRENYNTLRPNEAIGMHTPVSRYQISPRSFPEQLPPIEYDTSDIVRTVQAKGELYFNARVFRISKAFRAQPVALRPTPDDGIYDVFFCNQKIAQINLLTQPNHGKKV